VSTTQKIFLPAIAMFKNFLVTTELKRAPAEEDIIATTMYTWDGIGKCAYTYRADNDAHFGGGITCEPYTPLWLSQEQWLHQVNLYTELVTELPPNTAAKFEIPDSERNFLSVVCQSAKVTTYYIMTRPVGKFKSLVCHNIKVSRDGTRTIAVPVEIEGECPFDEELRKIVHPSIPMEVFKFHPIPRHLGRHAVK
jgi:hypothetical protein